MDINKPVSGIMQTKLFTVGPLDPLSEVKKIFDTHKIHHIPVVKYKKMVGLISKADYLYVIHGVSLTGDKDAENAAIFANVKVEDIMTKGIAKIEPSDKIAVAMEIFKENLFRAIPIVDDEELVGMVTTYDIISYCLENA